MTKLQVAALWMAVLAAPSFAAVNKDGGRPSVNPCGPGAAACAGENPKAAAAEPEASEPMVIYLDAKGETLLKVPLSKFRELEPDAKLPPELSGRN